MMCQKGHGIQIKKSYNFSTTLRLSNGEKINFENGLNKIFRKGVSITVSKKVAKNSLELIDFVIVNSKQKILIHHDVKVNGIVEFDDFYIIELVFLYPGEGIILSNKVFKNYDPDLELEEEEILNIENMIIALTSRSDDIKIAELDESERDALYRFRFREYEDLGKVDESAFPGKLLKDDFDNCSHILTAKINGNIIGTVRVTLQDNVDMFDAEINNNRTKIREGDFRYGEISRFCVSRYFRGALVNVTDLYTKLYLPIFEYCINHNVDILMLTSLKAHERIYRKYGFECTGKEIKIEKFNYSYFIMINSVKHAPTITLPIKPILFR